MTVIKAKNKLSVIFLGRKKYAAQALEFLLQNEITVVFLVAPQVEEYTPSLRIVSTKYNIPLVSPNRLYDYITKHPQKVDLVISYLFWKVIRKPLIELGRNGCVNYHNAILPDYKGLGGYNLAILNKLNNWGTSVHYIDSEAIDAGPIVNVQTFFINSKSETAYSLDQKTQPRMLAQFKKTILPLIKRRAIQTISNAGGIYFSKSDYDKYKRVTFNESTAEISRKIRAFWYPPYDGAYIEKNGKRYTLVSPEILKTIRMSSS